MKELTEQVLDLKVEAISLDIEYCVKSMESCCLNKSGFSTGVEIEFHFDEIIEKKPKKKK